MNKLTCNSNKTIQLHHETENVWYIYVLISTFFLFTFNVCTVNNVKVNVICNYPIKIKSRLQYGAILGRLYRHACICIHSMYPITLIYFLPGGVCERLGYSRHWESGSCEVHICHLVSCSGALRRPDWSEQLAVPEQTNHAASRVYGTPQPTARRAVQRAAEEQLTGQLPG